MTPEKIQEVRNNLFQFTGSDRFYRHFTKHIYTQGVQYVADKCGAYWLIDLIMSHQCDPKVRKEEFQQWKLFLNKEGSSAVAICDDGNGNEVTRQEIEYTTFPNLLHKEELVDGNRHLSLAIVMWFENQTLFLPQER